ncbi:acyl-CoA dehydrogenase [Salipiger aestuarii]|uniref:Acyl-CoA dehydrogenase n=1 Tax=Salipiger aestuarii TaxID=568098 RepID=A0A327XZT1_9RHOB|nr:acyl-CoA dehydrogenase family protein [Salipiger aestuarii]RAK14054.1 acyl-CoA dehydrogenase [Salipiger aestuarii]
MSPEPKASLPCRGLRLTQGPDLLAPRALGQLALDGVSLAPGTPRGAEGLGYVYAVQTIDAFRMSVDAAANDFARRALGPVTAHVVSRKVKGGMLAEMQLVQAALADMQVDLNAAEWLVAQVAWKWGRGARTASLGSASTKLLVTETAQQIFDRAMQLFGAVGDGYDPRRIDPSAVRYRASANARISEVS